MNLIIIDHISRKNIFDDLLIFCVWCDLFKFFFQAEDDSGSSVAEVSSLSDDNSNQSDHSDSDASMETETR